MPVFPFDDTKFYALTHMLNVLSKRNRDWDRQLWEHKGFNPALAYQIHCAQCHGEFLGGTVLYLYGFILYQKICVMPNLCEAIIGRE